MTKISNKIPIIFPIRPQANHNIYLPSPYLLFVLTLCPAFRCAVDLGTSIMQESEQTINFSS